MKLQLVVTKEQLTALTEVLDLTLKVRGLERLSATVDLYNVLLAAKEIKEADVKEE